MLGNVFSLVGQISPSHLSYAVKFISSLENDLDKYPDKHISIFINSHGGDAESAMQIYLKFRNLKRKGWKITTIGDLDVKSGAFLVYLLGDKRYAYPRAKFMYHKSFKPFDITLNISGIEDIKKAVKENNLLAEAKMIEKANSYVREEISRITNIPEEELGALNEMTLNAEEAMKLGIVHEILNLKEEFV